MDEYRRTLAEYLGIDSNQVFLYWKGRVALYALLRAIDLQPGDEVILPAYTCVVVPNAILYAGGKPVYVDVSPDTCNMVSNRVEAAITPRTRAVICQNTYGLSSDLEAITAIARRHDLVTIEDCTHGFGGQYHGRPNGLHCDAAFFSTQWNKPFSSGIGGFAITRNSHLRKALEASSERLTTPPTLSLLNLQLLYLVRRHLLSRRTYWTLVRLYRWLSRHNLIVGSSSGDELVEPVMPKGYFRGFSRIQAREALRNLSMLDSLQAERLELAERYTQFLRNHDKHHVPPRLFADHAFLKYPLLVHDRETFMARAEAARISLGDWFVSPLHPVTEHLSRWFFDPAQFPMAGFLARHVVNLPTNRANSDEVLGFLRENIDNIFSRQDFEMACTSARADAPETSLSGAPVDQNTSPIIAPPTGTGP